MEDTTVDGRLDIVVFPNKGREFLGRLKSTPPVPEEVYLPEVQKFIDTLPEMKEPAKYTGIYRVENGGFQITWGPYAGEIPGYRTFDIPHVAPETQAMMRERGWAFDENGHPYRPQGGEVIDV